MNMDILLRRESLNLWGGIENMKIFHISDIHLKWNSKKLDFIYNSMMTHQPELVIFTGDYYDIPSGLKLFVDFVRMISANFKCVFICGNHENWFWSKERLVKKLKAIPNVVNVESVDFNYISKKGFNYLITSNFHRINFGATVEKKSIALIHNPENIVETNVAGIDLILAGHLHGGQFIFRKHSDHSCFPGNMIYRYCVDRVKIGGATLIVSKGIGDTLPFRYNCPKEIVLIEIE